MLTDAAQRHVVTAVAQAARNTPNAGSVTQSSTGAGGRTADSVSVEVERDASGTISWTVREAGGWSVDRASARVLAEPGGEGWKGVEFHQAPGGGRGSGTGPGLYVDVYTDFETTTMAAPPPSEPAPEPAPQAPEPAPQPEPPQASSCGVGGTVSAGNSCTYEVGGQTFTLRIDGTRVCFAFACAGANVRIISSNINGVPVTIETEGSGTSRRIVQLSPNLAAAAQATAYVLQTHESGQDSDYLAGGIWVRVPVNAASVADYEFGAFVDGNDPFRQANLAGLTGTATYSAEGGVTGVYSVRATNRNYFVDGDVTLRANFGDAGSLGSIGGTLSNFTGDAPAPDSYDGVVVTLGTASIGSADSGFFTGDTSTRGTDSAFTGKWGGQFYGNGAAGGRPGSVAGTFGGATADGGEAFIGVFGAYLQ